MRAVSWMAILAGVLLGAACGGGPTGDGGGGGGGGTPEWTVMVYLAGDNSLAVQGILDLDEMEDAGVDPRVRVVAQAEFSPDVLQQYQCTAACFNRPNFNTFRYAITQAGGSAKNGPDRGVVTDIGNVDMTDPNTLRAFVQWAQQNHPAKRYLLVLWNHGGGYTGLIQDETSAGSGLMTVDEMRTALAGLGPIDVIDFDMCLMAGYETLVKLDGIASFAVLSEEVVPGEGNPYADIINALQAAPTMDARAAAAMLVDRFHASFQGNKASTTKSAYDLAGLASFETALGALASDLQAGLPGLGATISQAAQASQKFSFPELTDIVNFLDSLEVRVQGQTALQNKIAAVRAQALAPSFRVNARARNGTGSGQQGAADVSRATGLHIVLPSGSGQDVFAQSGPQSLAAYQALYPSKPWTQFLTAFAGGQPATPVVDQGNQRFEAYLVWEPQAVPAGADVDFWVLEPNGNIYIPAFGSVTPNGTMSNDSYADGVNFEGYLTNRFVEQGDYDIFANLWRDPQNFHPAYDLAYRYDQTAGFALFYTDQSLPLPVLSLQVSWLDDPTPTIAEIKGGAYTDLQYVATQSYPSAPAPSLRREPAPGVASLRAPRALTPAQVAVLRQAVTAHRLGTSFRAPGSPRLWDLPFGRGGSGR